MAEPKWIIIKFLLVLVLVLVLVLLLLLLLLLLSYELKKIMFLEIVITSQCKAAVRSKHLKVIKV